MPDTLDLETVSAPVGLPQLSLEQQAKIEEWNRAINRLLQIQVDAKTGRAGGFDVRQEAQVLELQKVAIASGSSISHFTPIGIFSADQIKQRFGSGEKILEVPAYQVNPKTLKIEKLPPEDGVMVYKQGEASH